MYQSSDKFSPVTYRRGVTLIEILVVLTILSILSGIVLISSKWLTASRKTAEARQQLHALSIAIDQYAAFWPAWNDPAFAFSDKGWPHFVPSELFPSPAFNVVPGFNPTPLPSPAFVETDIFYASGDIKGTSNVANAGACLAYALSNPPPKISSLGDLRAMNLQSIGVVDHNIAATQYPGPVATVRNREMFLDPWGKPIRYFWVYRDPRQIAPKAYKGYLPVGTSADPLPHHAVGFVLESAGPDGKFGDVWKISPTAQEVNDAADNLVISP